MARRPVATVAAVLLFLEAIGIVLLNMILGIAVDRQNMSLDGLDPDVTSVSTWIMGGVFGLYLVACAVVLLRSALRARAPGRFARALLISCAVVHAILGMLTAGLAGWAAFVFMMVVLALSVLALLGFGVNRTKPVTTEDSPAGTPPAPVT